MCKKQIRWRVWLQYSNGVSLMDCEEFNEHIIEYFTNPDLDWKIRDGIEQHYFECDKCYETFLTAQIITSDEVNEKSKEYLVGSLLDDAKELIKAKKYDEAIDCLEDALILEPSEFWSGLLIYLKIRTKFCTVDDLSEEIKKHYDNWKKKYNIYLNLKSYNDIKVEDILKELAESYYQGESVWVNHDGVSIQISKIELREGDQLDDNEIVVYRGGKISSDPSHKKLTLSKNIEKKEDIGDKLISLKKELIKTELDLDNTEKKPDS